MAYNASQSLLGRVLNAESGGDPNSLSPTGAMGLMQLMPGTAKNPGFGVKGTSDPWNPQENMRVGTDYLNAMLNRYGGDQEAALIAYNAGPGNADKWVASGRNYGALPKRSETEPYVRKILGSGGSLAEQLSGSGSGYIGGTAAAPAQGAMPGAAPEALVPPNMRYSKLADAFLASAAGAKPQGWGDLLNASGDLALGYTLGNKADKEKAAYSSKLSQMLQGAATPEAMTSTLISSGDPDLQKAGIQAKISEAQAQRKAAAPLRGKERFLVTPNGVMDITTNEIVPGTARPVAGPKDPTGYRSTPDNNLTFIPGGPADPATNNKQVKYNEGQTKAANFGNMMAKAEAELEAKTGRNPDGTPGTVTNPKNLLGAVRDGIVPLEGLRNMMRPDDTQAYEQAAGQWIRAKLRKESGAAIGKDEMANEFTTYFPQYWDGPETIAQKARSRAEAQKGMIAESGGAYGQLFPSREPEAGGAVPPAVAAPAPPKQSGPPAPAVQFLQSQPTPEHIAQFDAKYGPGAAQKILGVSRPQSPQSTSPQVPLYAGNGDGEIVVNPITQQGY